MQKEYNTKKDMQSIVKLKNRIKKQKEGMAKMQFVKQVKQMDQKYEEVLHSPTRLGLWAQIAIYSTSMQSKIHETKTLIKVLCNV